jgi:hypothetical protein
MIHQVLFRRADGGSAAASEKLARTFVALVPGIFFTVRAVSAGSDKSHRGVRE